MRIVQGSPAASHSYEIRRTYLLLSSLIKPALTKMSQIALSVFPASRGRFDTSSPVTSLPYRSEASGEPVLAGAAR
jgi:hypothetical protein